MNYENKKNIFSFKNEQRNYNINKFYLVSTTEFICNLAVSNETFFFKLCKIFSKLVLAYITTRCFSFNFRLKFCLLYTRKCSNDNEIIWRHSGRREDIVKDVRIKCFFFCFHTFLKGWIVLNFVKKNNALMA